jgi:hypothetical protein
MVLLRGGVGGLDWRIEFISGGDVPARREKRTSKST